MAPNIKEQFLKPFKRQLKNLIISNNTTEFLLQTNKNSIHYEAKAVADLLFITVPGSKEIEGEQFQISPLSLKRKQHTLKTFMEKRIGAQNQNLVA